MNEVRARKSSKPAMATRGDGETPGPGLPFEADRVYRSSASLKRVAAHNGEVPVRPSGEQKGTYRICTGCKREIPYESDVVRIQVVQGSKLRRAGAYCASCARILLGRIP